MEDIRSADVCHKMSTEPAVKETEPSTRLANVSSPLPLMFTGMVRLAPGATMKQLAGSTSIVIVPLPAAFAICMVVPEPLILTVMP